MDNIQEKTMDTPVPSVSVADDKAVIQPSTQTWRDSLPADFKDHPTLKPYNSIEDLIKSHVEAQKLIGADKVAIPGKDAKPEELEAYYNKLGRPEKPEGYEFKLPENLPQGAGFDKEGIKAIAETAHKLGIPKTQMEALFSEVVTMQANQAVQQAKEFYIDPATSDAKLTEVFGQAKQEKANDVQQFLDPVFAKHPWIGEWLDNTGLTNAAPLMIILAEAAAMTKESGSPKGGDGGPGSISNKLTPAEAQAAFDKLTLDPEHQKAYYDRNHPGHRAAVEKQTKLSEMKVAKPEVLFDTANLFGKPSSF